MYINKKIGIWGYGVVGRSAAHYFSLFNNQISVMDERIEIKKEIENNGILQYYNQEEQNSFFFTNDFIFVSSGINIKNHYATLKDKLIVELDFFQNEWKKPVIAITGTVGKTTVTTFLSHILQKSGLKVGTAGNIGIGCFDLLLKQDDYDIVVLEVSSFQLEYCILFCPTIAIWTNFFPNHLDRHVTQETYFDAKYTILLHQRNTNVSIVPLELYHPIKDKGYCIPNSTFFCVNTPSLPMIENISNKIFFIQNNSIAVIQNKKIIPIVCMNDLPTVTLPINWVILCAALDHLSINKEKIPSLTDNLQAVEHRIEKVATIKGVTFYNDSKSTTIQATLAAVDTLQQNPIHLFLGGLSKGVDRAPLLKELYNRVDFIYCFGKEAQELYTMCISNNIPAESFLTVDSAFDYCLKQVKNGDQVLFSPAGSSYDFFKNYEERGKYFKKLVHNIEVHE